MFEVTTEVLSAMGVVATGLADSTTTILLIGVVAFIGYSLISGLKNVLKKHIW